MGKKEEITKLNKTIEECSKCVLRNNCKQPVPGGGNLDSDIFFVGEASGRDEDEQIKVFVGRSGKLLNAWIIKELRTVRKNVFVANICKCRPHNNRDPKPPEIAACIPYLDKQIDIIRPKIIIALGRVALQSLFNNNDLRITRERGHWKIYNDIPVLPTYHPAFYLRQSSETNREAIKADLKKVVEKLNNL